MSRSALVPLDSGRCPHCGTRWPLAHGRITEHLTPGDEENFGALERCPGVGKLPPTAREMYGP